MQLALCDLLKIKYPIIMAPMFLVTNEKMMIEADQSGISGCIPALNYRTPAEFKIGIKKIRENCKNAVGVNLIVNASNPYFPEQLKILIEENVDYVITSLGSPATVIAACFPRKIKVFCDVTDLAYALKVQDMGADAVIAVNSGAGGHAGNIPASVLIPLLKKHLKIPVISAGGVGDGASALSMVVLGADGFSIGTMFIASPEAAVSQEYKEAIVNFSAKDIVMTTKISGTPCSVINTPYVKKMGLKQTWFEEILNKNKTLKKYIKMLTFYRGMKALEKAAFSATYKSVWCAGPSLEFVNEIRPIKKHVEILIQDFKDKQNALVNRITSSK
jgi:nitronate monooxygenase